MSTLKSVVAEQSKGNPSASTAEVVNPENGMEAQVMFYPDGSVRVLLHGAQPLVVQEFFSGGSRATEVLFVPRLESVA